MTELRSAYPLFLRYRKMDERLQLVDSALESKGWSKKETIDSSDWWADKIWKIESRWSPEGVPAFITFLVDPQIERNDKKNEDVWGIGISSTLPTSRTEAEKNGTLALKKIHLHLNELTGLLEPLRSGAINDLRQRGSSHNGD